MTPNVFSAPFLSCDFDQITPRKVFGGDSGLKDRVLAIASNPNNRVRTVFCKGEPVAILAICSLWDGVAEVLAVTSDDITRCPLSFHRHVKDLLTRVDKSMNLHRVQVTVQCDFVTGVRWIESLGFNREGKLKSFGPDKADYFMYGRAA